MEDASRFAIRERKAADSLAVIPPPAVLPWDQMPREPHLLDYLVVLRKHQWLILTFLLTVVTVVTIASFKMKPIYQAAARVEVDKESSQSTLPFQEGNSYDEYVDMDSYLETQTKILQSETLAFQTIKSLDLARYPEFGGGPGALAFGQGGAGSKRPAILGAFLGALSVKRVPNSRLIEVQFEAEDPQLAAQIVNAHLQNYIEQNFRSKYDATTQASNWLSSELEELRIKVEKSEDARLAYERQNQIWQIDEKQDITTQKLADLSKVVTEAQTGLAEKEALYRMAQTGNVDALPAARENPVIQDLLKRKSETDAAYADAINQYGPNYPKVQRLAAQQKEAGRRSGKRAEDDGRKHRGGIQHRPKPRRDSSRGARQAEGGRKRPGGKARAVPHPAARCRSQQAALRRLAAKIERGDNFGRPPIEQHSRGRSGARAFRSFPAAEVSEYPPGVSGRARRRHRSRDLPRVSR